MKISFQKSVRNVNFFLSGRFGPRNLYKTLQNDTPCVLVVLKAKSFYVEAYERQMNIGVVIHAQWNPYFWMVSFEYVIM